MADLEKVHRPANRVDDTILRWADSESPDGISRMLGGVVSPSAVASRTQALLRSVDWLTAAQEDQLITLRMKALLRELEDHIDGKVDDKILRLRLATLEKIGDRLDRRRSATDVDLNTLYGNQGAIMGRVVDMALTYMRGALREEVEPDRWNTLVKEALLMAQNELSKHEAVEE